MKLFALSCLSLFLLSSLNIDARVIETQCPECGKHYIVGTHHKCPPKRAN